MKTDTADMQLKDLFIKVDTTSTISKTQKEYFKALIEMAYRLGSFDSIAEMIDMMEKKHEN